MSNCIVSESTNVSKNILTTATADHNKLACLYAGVDFDMASASSETPHKVNFIF